MDAQGAGQTVTVALSSEQSAAFRQAIEANRLIDIASAVCA